MMRNHVLRHALGFTCLNVFNGLIKNLGTRFVSDLKQGIVTVCICNGKGSLQDDVACIYAFVYIVYSDTEFFSSLISTQFKMLRPR